MGTASVDGGVPISSRSSTVTPSDRMDLCSPGPLFLRLLLLFSHLIFSFPICWFFLSRGSISCIFSFLGFYVGSGRILAPLMLINGDTTISLHRYTPRWYTLSAGDERHARLV